MLNKFITFVSLVLTICINIAFADAISDALLFPAEISGKILGKDGKLFIDPVTVVITANIVKDASEVDYTGDHYKHIEYRQNVTGGVFSWKGQARDVDIKAEKEGFHSSFVTARTPPGYNGREIKSNNIFIYLIPAGTPSKLEYTEGADIPDKTDPKFGDKVYGWSFVKKWYFPVDEETSVWMVLSYNEKGDAVYTMKEPGGFIWYPGYPQFEGMPDKLSAEFGWMTEAPETGYVQRFTPKDHYYRPNVGQSIYCYFRTPDGKYGKMRFGSGLFSYYLQPDGSRNLEAGEVVRKGPRNPIEAEWLDEELGKDN